MKIMHIHIPSVKAHTHTKVIHNVAVTRRKPLAKSVGEAIRAHRAAHKLTQPQVVSAAKARGYQVDQGSISRIERGQMIPTVDTLEAIAAGMDIPAWHLLVASYDPINPPVLREATAEERELWKRLSTAASKLGLTQ